MSEPIVILVGGLLTAGKDEFADRLVAEHGFVKLGMSDTLREATRRLTSVYVRVDDNFVTVPELLESVGYVRAKELSPGYRVLLQELGTEVGRDLLGKNIWVEAAKSRILETMEQHPAGVVLTGARFPNELDMVQYFEEWRDITATSVWVDRPGLEAASHASEGSVSRNDFEYVLNNTGTLEDLAMASDELLALIRADYS